MAELARRTWDELIAPNESVHAATPSGAVLLALLHDSASAWWDDRATATVRENRDAILAASLAAAYDTVFTRYGAPDGDGWKWERVGTADMHHLLRLPGFSSLGVPLQGGRGTLNPSVQNGGFGSSWRMVVELGDRVRAMGTYPGGQSGNPASARYRDRLRFWSDGDLEFLIAPAALDSLTPSQVSASLTLLPERTRP